MSPAVHILAAVLDAAAAVLLMYWSVGLARLISTSRRIPTARAGIALATGLPKPPVCIIIPAHNEEASIGALVESLRQQDYPRFHACLCLDRCTDRTHEIARAAAADDPRISI